MVIASLLNIANGPLSVGRRGKRHSDDRHHQNTDDHGNSTSHAHTLPDARAVSATAADTLAALAREADAALYEAKRLGRNRVHAAAAGTRFSAA